MARRASSAASASSTRDRPSPFLLVGLRLGVS
uniref:ATPB n=1 Tax=Arundo donax TaxID=35708 RepID=A0A0A9BWT0_ARUDO